MPSTLEARCSLLKFCMDFFPMLDILRNGTSSLDRRFAATEMGFPDASIKLPAPGVVCVPAGGVPSSGCCLWDTVETVWHAKRWVTRDLSK